MSGAADHLLALAINRRAYLVTGDQDLLVLSDELPILTPARFATKLPETSWASGRHTVSAGPDPETLAGARWRSGRGPSTTACCCSSLTGIVDVAAGIRVLGALWGPLRRQRRERASAIA